MGPRETILEQAAAVGAAIIGVSGLITPSLFQMEELCREMAARSLTTPLLVGGATTSALHTAVKLAPLYDHVFYAPDASACAVLAGRLVADRAATEAEEHRKQEELRKLYEEGATRSPIRSGMTAAVMPGTAVMPGLTGHPHPFPPESYLRGACFEPIPTRELTVAEVLPFFDWQIFYAIWGVRHSGPQESHSGLDPESPSDSVVQLSADAIGRLEALKREGGCRIRIAARFDACHAEGDEIVSEAGWRLPMLRQEGPEGRSLADFVAPADYGFDSPSGMFAISVHAAGCDCPACAMEYGSLLDRSLRLALAEAASCWLDDQLGKQLPKGSPVRIIKPAAGYASCPDHSLKRDILALLPDADALDIRLTDSCAMIPDASICGLVFAHPSAAYPDIRRLSPAALDAYAARRGFTPEEQKSFLGHLR
jgi:5-methyltetrahydrofolate--homocysteine methyltransferase